jgi:two-component system nitrate/nitrite response regulator NarL
MAQPLTAEGVARVLEPGTGLRFAGYATDAGVAAEEVIAQVPDLFLVDHAFGLAALLRLLTLVRRRSPSVRTILWTNQLAESDRRLALEAGLSGVLPCDLAPEEILERLRGFLSEGESSGAAGMATGLKALAQRLTEREREVAGWVMQGLTNKEIAGRMSITPGTVKVHLMHVFEKTGCRDRYDLAACGKNLQPESRTGIKPGINPGINP